MSVTRLFGFQSLNSIFERSDTMIKIGIVGYGNLAKGAEAAISQNPDMELVAVFTRREPATVKIRCENVPVLPLSQISQWKDRIQILLLCGGSASDLPTMTPELAEHFHVVDSFDTHAKIPEHCTRVDAVAKSTNHIAIISGGWDPGLFSLSRIYASAILPQSSTYTFWGRGVSQGHSDAVRRIEGVADCRQYTIPVSEAMDAVREGKNPDLTTREKHTRHCFVVTHEGADLSRIENEIKTMPNYFADYDTTVTFITKEEMERDHSGLPHGGHVICTGITGQNREHHQRIEYSLTLDSNPEFTASVLLACARAAMRMADRGCAGCYTMFDIAPADLSPYSREELLSHYL